MNRFMIESIPALIIEEFKSNQEKRMARKGNFEEDHTTSLNGQMQSLYDMLFQNDFHTFVEK
jgi:hypothetical protein